MLSSSGNPSGHKRQVFGGIITPITPPHIHQLTPCNIHILQYFRFHNQIVRANIKPCTKQLVENITWERHWIDHLPPFSKQTFGYRVCVHVCTQIYKKTSGVCCDSPWTFLLLVSHASHGVSVKFFNQVFRMNTIKTALSYIFPKQFN